MSLVSDWKDLNHTSKKYLISRFLLAGFYTWPFWYGFAIERISPADFGLYIAVAYLISTLAEVPTGAFADKFGRKKSALIGILMQASYVFVVFYGRTLEFYLLSALISGMGSAFVSGSLEAMVFESEGMTKQKYRRVSILESLFWQSGLVLATALGGLLFSVNQILPFVAQGLSFLLAFLVVWGIGERSSDHGATTDKVTRRDYIKQNIQGFAHLFKEQSIRPLILFGLILSSVVSVGIENLNEASMIYYGYNPESRGLILALTKLIVVILLAKLIIKRLTTDKSKILYLYLLLVGSFLLFSIVRRELFLAGFLLFNLVSSTMDNFIKPILHDHIHNKFRATAISTYNFVTNIFIAVLAVGIGIALKYNSPIVVQRYLLALIVIACGLTLKVFFNRYFSQKVS
jgi:MFS family permease